MDGWSNGRPRPPRVPTYRLPGIAANARARAVTPVDSRKAPGVVVVVVVAPRPTCLVVARHYLFRRLDDSLGKNSESWLVSRALKMLPPRPASSCRTSTPCMRHDCHDCRAMSTSATFTERSISGMPGGPTWTARRPGTTNK